MTTTRTATSTWTIDPTHSVVEFAVKHLMVSTFKGHFRSLEGTVHLDEDNPANSSVTASVDVASIDTQTPDRDAHLRSDDFFNAERYPKMTFRSTRVEQADGTNWKVTGELTIRDVTKEVVLDTEFEGRIVDPWGNERIGFTAQAELSRKEFGVRWNAAIETGGVVVGDKVRISLNIEIVRRQS
jgi:polyisoprenoid-binding protein YceI